MIPNKIYRNFNQNDPKTDFQTIENLIDCLDEQRRYSLEREEQRDRYIQLSELKREKEDGREKGSICS